jgi:hypothetical protein
MNIGWLGLWSCVLVTGWIGEGRFGFTLGNVVVDLEMNEWMGRRFKDTRDPVMHVTA